MKQVRAGSKQLIKDLNRSLVLNTLHQYSPISRTDISKKTQLGLSTITKIIDSLQADNWVFETGTSESSGGRRPVMLDFNASYGFVMGVKIEENQLLLAVSNLYGELMTKKTLSFARGESVDYVMDLLINGIKSLSVEPFKHEEWLGIGVIVSGHVDGESGTIIRSPLLGWNNVNVKQRLQVYFNVPIFCDNNVNAYTLAELMQGHGKTSDNFICVSIGAGIGAGVVTDGRIYYGFKGGAGEFGHTIISMDGFTCHCGQKGCLEMYASERFLEKEGARLAAEHPEASISQAEMTFEGIKACADQGDIIAITLLEQTGKHLGVGLTNLINNLNPELIVLIGEGMVAESYFLPAAITVAEQNFFAQGGQQTVYLPSELGNDAWLSGAALLAIQKIFESPIYQRTAVLE